MDIHHQASLEYTLIKYFSDKATPEEEIFVQQWIAKSQNNTSYYHKIQRLWLHRIVL